LFFNIEQIIGVAQLCNKINGNCFTKFDEERTVGFAIFVGLSLVQVIIYRYNPSDYFEFFGKNGI